MLHVRTMTPADVPLGMRLKQQAGWNQTEADWHRLLGLQPDGCFVAELDGQGVGTTMTCCFGPVAWVAMVLVDTAVRGRGIGTALMEHALAWLEGQGVRSVRLDATPLGQPVYEKLGFVAEYRLARYQGTLPPPAAAAQAAALRPEDVEGVLQLDRHVTSTDRRKWICRLMEEWPEAMRVLRRGGEVVGFVGARRGAVATQIGPCLAAGGVGPLLGADAWARFAGQPVFLDVPLGNRAAVALAEGMGLTVQRHLLRMGRGERVTERVEQLWASSGPEMG